MASSTYAFREMPRRLASEVMASATSASRCRLTRTLGLWRHERTEPVEGHEGWDGGSEFLKEFGARVAELRLTHYFNRPNYPQGNGRIERSFRTDEEEFYQVEDLPADLGRLEQALLAWNRTYETVRPHQALGYKTPDQFYHHWLNTNATRKEVFPICPDPVHAVDKAACENGYSSQRQGTVVRTSPDPM